MSHHVVFRGIDFFGASTFSGHRVFRGTEFFGISRFSGIRAFRRIEFFGVSIFSTNRLIHNTFFETILQLWIKVETNFQIKNTFSNGHSFH